jgi:hypothetical protein
MEGINMVKEYSKMLTRLMRLEHQNRTHVYLHTVTISCMQSFKRTALFHSYYSGKEGIEAFYAAGYPQLTS